MSGEIEILPPEKNGEKTVSVSMQRQMVDRLRDPRVAIPLAPGSPVPSGHWWVFIEGRGNALQGSAPDGYVEMMLNGQTLQYPIGVWAVMDNRKFHVAKESDLPMLWFDGHDLIEKTITWETRGRSNTPYRVIGQRLRSKPQTEHLALR